jgi:hypothetical protein
MFGRGLAPEARLARPRPVPSGRPAPKSGGTVIACAATRRFELFMRLIDETSTLFQLFHQNRDKPAASRGSIHDSLFIVGVFDFLTKFFRAPL